MNDEALIRRFMKEIADREFSDWVAKKSYSYVKALLDTASNLGLVQGNAARLIPAKQRIPKGVKKAHSQPFITAEQFVKLLSAITRPRDQIILKIPFLCAVRRSDLLVLKWKDFSKSGEMYTFTIQRSFDSRTHKIMEWNSALEAHGKSQCRQRWPRTSKAGASTATPTATIQNRSSFRPAMELV